MQTPLEAFSLFSSDKMLNNLVEYTNNLIYQFIANHRKVIENSDKYSVYKAVDLTDINAFLGLLYCIFYILYCIYMCVYIYTHIYTYMVTSVVLYSLTRATLMSPGQDKTHVCGYVRSEFIH